MSTTALQKTRQKGTLMVDVLVGIGLLTVGVVAVALLVLGTIDSYRHMPAHQGALYHAREGASVVSAMIRADSDAVSAGSYGVERNGVGEWQLVAVPDTHGIYERTITVSDESVYVKRVVTSVAWSTTPARAHQFTLEEDVYDWRQTRGESGDASVDLSGAEYMVSSSELQGMTIMNAGGSDVTLTGIRFTWDTGSTVQLITVAGVPVYDVGTSTGAVSGQFIDIDDVVVPWGGVPLSVSPIRWSGDISGTTIIMNMIFSDGTENYSRIYSAS